MSLTVEDGTGLEGAESYVSLADHKAYWLKRDVDLEDDYTDAQLEAGLRRGFNFVNRIGRYKAVTLTLAQAGEFPRDGLTDWNGRTITGVPRQVKEAQNEVSYKALTEDLLEDLDRGGKVTSESIGPISVTYAFDAPVGKLYRATMLLLAPFLRSAQDSFPPSIGGVAGQTSTVDPATELTPIFSVGMHSNNSGE